MSMKPIAFSNNIPQLIPKLRENRFKNIVTITGAGISVASGIPDFRSPGGLYDSLNPELLTATDPQKEYLRYDPMGVVSWDLFRVNQFPYLEVRRPFILGTAEGKWKATLSHFFIQLLFDKGLLKRHYTQNIDGLDFQMFLPAEKIVTVHGSIAKANCEFCRKEYSMEKLKCGIKTKIKNIYDNFDIEAPVASSNIYCDFCSRPGIKPSTVLFGRELPKDVWKAVSTDFPSNIDLVIIIGTSLLVHPACDFVNRVLPNVPRLVINREVVGEELGFDFGTISEFLGHGHNPQESRDSIILGDCDESICFLLKELGWTQEIIKYREFMCSSSVELLDKL